MNKLLSIIILALLNYLLYEFLNKYVFIFYIMFILPVVMYLREYYFDNKIIVIYDDEKQIYIKMYFKSKEDKEEYQKNLENDDV